MTNIACRKCGDTGYFIATYSGLYCNKCGTKHLVDPPAPVDFLATLVSIVTPLFEKEIREIKEILPGFERCPECGITWEEIAKDGRLGCANDYKVFEDKLSVWLLEIHGANQHKIRE